MEKEVQINKIEWTESEYNHKEKNPDWYWTVGLIAVIGAIVSIWLHNYLLAIFILVSGGTMILFAIRAPQEIYFSIDNKGMTMGRDFFEWGKINGFTIKKKENGSVLLIELKRKILPHYTVPIKDIQVEELRENLEKVLPILELKESNSVLFAEKIGF
ncbi:TPA: hypothetical protein DIC38_00470 [Candidatus Nomurabacteria bacterium]|nr:MAG: hypothetical protein O210_OD1C00001G0635 [Parcubacteria bacterium RAAC4_OD1_1]HCY26146.1 hypothetical protein [Candidatus Nomurabacteria bacterium]